MYYIVSIIIVLTGLFLIYKFYPQIDSFIKQHIIPSQKVINIKKEMRDLDSSSNEKSPPPPDSILSKFVKITDQIKEIAHLPLDFLYKSAVSFGTPIFYIFRIPTDKTI